MNQVKAVRNAILYQQVLSIFEERCHTDLQINSQYMYRERKHIKMIIALELDRCHCMNP